MPSCCLHIPILSLLHILKNESSIVKACRNETRSDVFIPCHVIAYPSCHCFFLHVTACAFFPITTSPSMSLPVLPFTPSLTHYYSYLPITPPFSIHHVLSFASLGRATSRWSPSLYIIYTYTHIHTLHTYIYIRIQFTRHHSAM